MEKRRPMQRQIRGRELGVRKGLRHPRHPKRRFQPEGTHQVRYTPGDYEDKGSLRGWFAPDQYEMKHEIQRDHPEPEWFQIYRAYMDNDPIPSRTDFERAVKKMEGYMRQRRREMVDKYLGDGYFEHKESTKWKTPTDRSINYSFPEVRDSMKVGAREDKRMAQIIFERLDAEFLNFKSMADIDEYVAEKLIEDEVVKLGPMSGRHNMFDRGTREVDPNTNYSVDDRDFFKSDFWKESRRRRREEVGNESWA